MFFAKCVRRMLLNSGYSRGTFLEGSFGDKYRTESSEPISVHHSASANQHTPFSIRLLNFYILRV